MMEKKISAEVENDKYPVESLPRPAPASNDSKIGKIRIRTPAEINKEYDETPNSVSASMLEDSSDRLRALSFADFLRPPIPIPSPSVMSTVPQLMESSAKAVKPKRKSKYPGFGQTIPPASPSASKPKGKSRYLGFGQTIPPASHSVSKPKPKSRYRGFGESIQSQQTELSAKVGKPNPWRFQPESSRSRENQEKVDSNFSSVDRTYSTSSSVTTSFPMSSPVIRSYPAPSSVITASVTRSFLTPSKAVISYSTPVTASYPMLSSVTPSYPTPASIATSRPTKSVPNETGSGIRRNFPGFGGTTIPSPSQGNLLKEHRVSDNDAKNISASWKKLKPSVEPTDTEIPNKKQDSMSASVSKSCAARSSSSQTAEDQVGESSSNQVKQVCQSHKLPQGTPILLQHFRPNPGFEKEKLYNISQPTGFNLRGENMASTSSSFLTSANSTSSQMNRKTKYKGFTSTPVSVSQTKSVPNRPGVEGSNIRKKYPGFGEVTNSNDLQVIEKIKDKSDNKNAKNSQTRTEGRKPVKPVTVREKISSNSTYKIHELDEISKPQGEDWDSSLREWIPSEQCANVPKRKAYRGFGKITNSQNKKKRKNKPITNAGVHSNVDNTNKQQPKINRSKELEIVSHLEIQQPEAVLQQEIQQPEAVLQQEIQQSLQVCEQQLQNGGIKNNMKVKPCRFFNEGSCKFGRSHLSKSKLTRWVHTCGFCFAKCVQEKPHPESHCKKKAHPESQCVYKKNAQDSLLEQNRSDAVSRRNRTEGDEKENVLKSKEGSTFTLVRSNVYPKCSCRGGDKGCMNNSCACVKIMQECHPDCSCGDTCINMGLTRGVGKLLRIGRSRIQGDGCFTEEDIRKGEYVGEYTGELVLRADQMKKKNPSKYLFEIGHEEILLDAENFGSKLAKMNHQTEKRGANCTYQLKRANGVWKVGVWALKNIKKGDELFANYGDNYRGHGLFTPQKKKSGRGRKKETQLEKKGKMKINNKKLNQRPISEKQPSQSPKTPRASTPTHLRTPKRVVGGQEVVGCQEVVGGRVVGGHAVVGGQTVTLTWVKSSPVIKDLPRPRLLIMTDKASPNVAAKMSNSSTNKENGLKPRDLDKCKGTLYNSTSVRRSPRIRRSPRVMAKTENENLRLRSPDIETKNLALNSGKVYEDIDGEDRT